MKILSPLLLALGLTGFAPKPKLVSTKLSPDLTVGIPAGFAAMPEAGIAMKYPSPRKPVAVFNSANGRVDYSIATRPSTFTSADYAVLLPIYKASIQRLYSKVEFLKEEIRPVNKRDVVYFEFVSTLTDSRRAAVQMAPLRKYQAVQYTVKDGQLYVFTFDAPAEEQAQWQPTAQAVMASVELK